MNITKNLTAEELVTILPEFKCITREKLISEMVEGEFGFVTPWTKVSNWPVFPLGKGTRNAILFRVKHGYMLFDTQAQADTICKETQTFLNAMAAVCDHASFNMVWGSLRVQLGEAVK